MLLSCPIQIMAGSYSIVALYTVPVGSTHIAYMYMYVYVYNIHTLIQYTCNYSVGYTCTLLLLVATHRSWTGWQERRCSKCLMLLRMLCTSPSPLSCLRLTGSAQNGPVTSFTSGSHITYHKSRLLGTSPCASHQKKLIRNMHLITRFPLYFSVHLLKCPLLYFR